VGATDGDVVADDEMKYYPRAERHLSVPDRASHQTSNVGEFVRRKISNFDFVVRHH